MFSTVDDAMCALQIDHPHLRVELKQTTKIESPPKTKSKPSPVQVVDTNEESAIREHLLLASLSPRGGDLHGATRFLNRKDADEAEQEARIATHEGGLVLQDCGEFDDWENEKRPSEEISAMEQQEFSELVAEISENDAQVTANSPIDSIDANDFSTSEVTPTATDLASELSDEVSTHSASALADYSEEQNNGIVFSDDDEVLVDNVVSTDSAENHTIEVLHPKFPSICNEELYRSVDELIELSDLSKADEESVGSASMSMDSECRKVPNVSKDRIIDKLKEVLESITIGKDMLGNLSHAHDNIDSVLETVVGLHENVIDSIQHLVQDEDPGYSLEAFLEMDRQERDRVRKGELVSMTELMKIKSQQHTLEVQDLEKEMLSLRLSRQEYEKVLASLRQDLRKCRSQLAIQASNSVGIQRECSIAQDQISYFKSQVTILEKHRDRLVAECDKLRQHLAETQLEKSIEPQDDVEKPWQDHHISHELHQDRYMDSMTNALQASKREISNQLQKQIDDTKSLLHSFDLTSTASTINAELKQQQNQLSDVMQKLTTQELHCQTQMEASKQELQKVLHANMPPASILYAASLQPVNYELSSTHYLTKPNPPMTPDSPKSKPKRLAPNSIAFSNQAMYDFQCALRDRS